MKKIYLLFTLFFAVVSIQAQSLNETLSYLSSDAATSYVTPITNGFGSNLNSGWFAYPPDAVRLGFTMRARIVGNGTFFSSDEENFSSTGSFRFNEQQANTIMANSGIQPGDPRYNATKAALLAKEWDVTFSGPTIIGSKDEYLKLKFEGSTALGLQPSEQEIEDVYGYLDGLPLFPSGNVQLTVGTVMGTNFVFRWFPSMDIQDLGKFSFYGFGAVHNTNVWFKNPLPVDISLGGFYQKLEVGDIFESSATQYGVYFSKTFGGIVAFTPYLGITGESATTTVSYTYKYDTPTGPEEVDVNFDIDGDNTVGVTAGFSIKLVVLNLNVDYKAAKTGTLTAGISFGIL